jgi:hypothetical protein
MHVRLGHRTVHARRTPLSKEEPNGGDKLAKKMRLPLTTGR